MSQLCLEVQCVYMPWRICSTLFNDEKLCSMDPRDPYKERCIFS